MDVLSTAPRRWRSMGDQLTAMVEIALMVTLSAVVVIASALLLVIRLGGQ